MTLALLLVALAAALDIAANVMLAKSCGFKKRLWGGKVSKRSAGEPL